MQPAGDSAGGIQLMFTSSRAVVAADCEAGPSVLTAIHPSATAACAAGSVVVGLATDAATSSLDVCIGQVRKNLLPGTC